MDFTTGIAFIDGYAGVRAFDHAGVPAWFFCPGVGSSGYCYRKALRIAEAAGFKVGEATKEAVEAMAD